MLDTLAGSRGSEARLRARLLLLTASGLASRAIARELGCMPGAVSNWRVRYARDRTAGLSETGKRGAEPKYGPAHNRRILALLDQPPPAGHGNWTALLLARELVDIHEPYIWRFLRARLLSTAQARVQLQRVKDRQLQITNSYSITAVALVSRF